ncbi:MAG: hypothetical protein ABSC03_18805 [Verrucomicrobiota bacterium]|jgi:hypothetical protein
MAHNRARRIRKSTGRPPASLTAARLATTQGAATNRVSESFGGVDGHIMTLTVTAGGR